MLAARAFSSSARRRLLAWGVTTIANVVRERQRMAARASGSRMPWRAAVSAAAS
jgi:hypothetical protein